MLCSNGITCYECIIDCRCNITCKLHLNETCFFILQYSSLDTSPISVYIMHPFWNRLVEVSIFEASPCIWYTHNKLSSHFQYMPRWVAPNLMTFGGFLMTAFNFLIVAYFDYNFVASAEPPVSPSISPLPRWLWLLIGTSLFVAYTLGITNHCKIYISYVRLC